MAQGATKLTVVKVVGLNKISHFDLIFINVGRKELYTSEESPVTHRLKADLKIEEKVQSEAPEKF